MFKDIFEKYDWDEVQKKIYQSTSADVDNALSAKKRDLNDFIAMISPAAAPYLEQMAMMSRELTQKRFGKTIQMYAPMYLSNECQNICTYCGFSLENKIKRKTLSDSEILLEAKALKAAGFDHILLVTGEANSTVDNYYFLNAVKILKHHFANISLEVQPLNTKK